MPVKNILLVTFPIDLGNRTIESNLHSIFENEMDFFRFAKQHVENIDSERVTISKSIIYRIESAKELRKKVKEYSRKDGTIVFTGLSPALFAFGAWKKNNTVIALDWTRTLQQTAYGQNPIRDIFFFLQRFILRQCPRILYSTSTLRRNLEHVYDVHASQLFKVPIPFLIETLDIPPRQTPSKPRVLFVGGDFLRKGGDLLIEAWRDRLSSKCCLSMMTGDKRAKVEGVNVLNAISYGSALHKKTFEDHDILILPTRFDSYPQVIGEAIAAGLAVITTRFALAAEETIINGQTGYIADSAEEAITLLDELLDDISLIDQFKKKGYILIKEKFSRKSIHDRYMEVILNT